MRLIADFASGVPDLASAPREGWAWATGEAYRTAPNTDFGYSDPAENRRLREILAGSGDHRCDASARGR